MSNVTYGPAIIVSRSGEFAIELVEFIGTASVPNRDATSFTFFIKTDPHGPPFRVNVNFSGTTLAFGEPMKSFGLPDYDRVHQFVHLSEVRLGDFLDEDGLPSPPEHNYYSTQLECYSDRLEAWEARRPATDDEVEEYVRTKLYHGWRYNRDTVGFRHPDLVRLRIPQPTLKKVIDQGDGSDWTVEQLKPLAFSLRPTRSLITQEREKRRAGKIRVVPSSSSEHQFVSEERIDELRGLPSTRFDLKRLISMLEELNICAAHRCLFSIAMLTRAILDHVPPIFGASNFTEVTNNYAGARSFKDSMRNLENSARKIADAHLHVQIRPTEVLPTFTQVNFSNDLDVLLGEIVRLLRTQPPSA